MSLVLEAVLWLYSQLELKGLHHMQNPLYSHILCYLHLNIIIKKKTVLIWIPNAPPALFHYKGSWPTAAAQPLSDHSFLLIEYRRQLLCDSFNRCIIQVLSCFPTNSAAVNPFYQHLGLHAFTAKAHRSILEQTMTIKPFFLLFLSLLTDFCSVIPYLKLNSIKTAMLRKCSSEGITL